MNFRDFLKDKLLAIAFLTFGVLTIEIFLLTYPPTFLLVYVPIIIFLTYFAGIGLEYYLKQKFYKKLESTLNDLDVKYLLNELIKMPDFAEGKILKNILHETDKSMLEHVNEYKRSQEDYKEYIELWIHEVKIPIATSKLIIENHKNSVTKSIDEELDKIENYTEQALYYARSSNVEKDYFVKKVLLKELVSESIKKNKNLLIRNGARVDAHDLNRIVYTDSKWLVFILSQLLSNSLKYKSQNRKLEIEIYAKNNKENVVLYLKDNGIGIKEGDLARVFEKGFTGENGRLLGKKSTGIGLYLCENLCKKLGIKIILESVENQGSEIKLIFPKDSRLALK